MGANESKGSATPISISYPLCRSDGTHYDDITNDDMDNDVTDSVRNTINETRANEIERLYEDISKYKNDEGGTKGDTKFTCVVKPRAKSDKQPLLQHDFNITDKHTDVTIHDNGNNTNIEQQENVAHNTTGDNVISCVYSEKDIVVHDNDVIIENDVMDTCVPKWDVNNDNHDDNDNRDCSTKRVTPDIVKDARLKFDDFHEDNHSNQREETDSKTKGDNCNGKHFTETLSDEMKTSKLNNQNSHRGNQTENTIKTYANESKMNNGASGNLHTTEENNENRPGYGGSVTDDRTEQSNTVILRRSKFKLSNKPTTSKQFECSNSDNSSLSFKNVSGDFNSETKYDNTDNVADNLQSSNVDSVTDNVNNDSIDNVNGNVIDDHVNCDLDNDYKIGNVTGKAGKYDVNNEWNINNHCSIPSQVYLVESVSSVRDPVYVVENIQDTANKQDYVSESVISDVIPISADVIDECTLHDGDVTDRQVARVEERDVPYNDQSVTNTVNKHAQRKTLNVIQPFWENKDRDYESDIESVKSDKTVVNVSYVSTAFDFLYSASNQTLNVIPTHGHNVVSSVENDVVVPQSFDEDSGNKIIRRWSDAGLRDTDNRIVNDNMAALSDGNDPIGGTLTLARTKVKRRAPAAPKRIDTFFKCKNPIQSESLEVKNNHPASIGAENGGIKKHESKNPNTNEQNYMDMSSDKRTYENVCIYPRTIVTSNGTAQSNGLVLRQKREEPAMTFVDNANMVTSQHNMMSENGIMAKSQGQLYEDVTLNVRSRVGTIPTVITHDFATNKNKKRFSNPIHKLKKVFAVKTTNPGGSSTGHVIERPTPVVYEQAVVTANNIPAPTVVNPQYVQTNVTQQNGVASTVVTQSTDTHVAGQHMVNGSNTDAPVQPTNVASDKPASVNVLSIEALVHRVVKEAADNSQENGYDLERMRSVDNVPIMDIKRLVKKELKRMAKQRRKERQRLTEEGDEDHRQRRHRSDDHRRRRNYSSSDDERRKSPTRHHERDKQRRQYREVSDDSRNRKHEDPFNRNEQFDSRAKVEEYLYSTPKKQTRPTAQYNTNHRDNNNPAYRHQTSSPNHNPSNPYQRQSSNHRQTQQNYHQRQPQQNYREPQPQHNYHQPHVYQNQNQQNQPQHQTYNEANSNQNYQLDQYFKSLQPRQPLNQPSRQPGKLLSPLTQDNVNEFSKKEHALAESLWDKVYNQLLEDLRDDNADDQEDEEAEVPAKTDEGYSSVMSSQSSRLEPPDILMPALHAHEKNRPNLRIDITPGDDIVMRFSDWNMGQSKSQEPRIKEIAPPPRSDEIRRNGSSFHQKPPPAPHNQATRTDSVKLDNSDRGWQPSTSYC